MTNHVPILGKTVYSCSVCLEEIVPARGCLGWAHKSEQPARYFHANNCYGNNDAEVRAAAVKQAAVAFPGSSLTIWGGYYLERAAPSYEYTQNHGYDGELFTASTISVKAVN